MFAHPKATFSSVLQAISHFVQQLLAGGSKDEEVEEGERGSGCCMTAEERSRNDFQSAWLLMSRFHPAAAGLLGSRELGREAWADMTDDDLNDEQAVCSTSSILSLLLPPRATSSGDGSDQHAVPCFPLDLAGQDVLPFSPGLLPGA